MLESSGYGLAALSYISGLIELGVTVNWRPLVLDNGTYKPWTKIKEPKHNVHRILRECLHNNNTIEKLLTCLAPLDTYSHILIHTVPEYWPSLIEKDRINIGYTVWETSDLPKHFPELINQVDCVLVPSRFSVQAFIRSGVTISIKTVPHILNSPAPIPHNLEHQLRKKINLNSLNTEKNFVFYTINEWNARKANWTLLHAFLKTFSKEEPVTLVIKTSETGPSNEFDSTRHDTKKLITQAILQYKNPPHVEVINKKLSQQEISALHDIGDCFVSTTHSEGWGLGLFEAAGNSNPIIATGWGGQLAFLDYRYTNLIQYSIIPTQNALGSSYSKDQRWAIANEEHTSQLFRRVYNRPREAQDKAKALGTMVNQKYNSKKVSLTLYEAMNMNTNSIPNQFHFVFGLKQQNEPFHLAYYLCLKSCLEINQPDAIHFHYHYEPHGIYWDLIKPDLILHHVDLEEFVLQSKEYSKHLEGKFIANQQLNYAHQADFIRLKALSRYGGVYADMDTIFIQPIPKALFQYEFVIGREKDVILEGSNTSTLSLCNAVMMAKPGAKFVDRWLNESYQAFDGSWSKHSCQLAAVIASKIPNDVLILPEHHFYKHPCTIDGIKTLFEGLDDDYYEVYSMHMWNHLWWEKSRTDFSHFHSGLLNEKYILEVDTTYNLIARDYLPEKHVAENPSFNNQSKPGTLGNKSNIINDQHYPTLIAGWYLDDDDEKDPSYIFNKSSKSKLEINSSSYSIIHLCDGKHTVANLIRNLSDKFNVNPNEIDSDIKEMLKDLELKKIIQLRMKFQE